MVVAIIVPPKTNEVPVYLTPEQAALFILFQENYDNIGFLISKRVFEMKGGNVTLSFDPNGKITSIKKEIFERR